jgi:hypothetical protein
MGHGPAAPDSGRWRVKTGGRRDVGVAPVRLRAELTWYIEQSLTFEIDGPEPGSFALDLRRGLLETRSGASHAAEVTLRFADKAALLDYLLGASLADLESASRVTVAGDRDAATLFATFIDEPAHMSRILVTLHGPAR